MAELILTNPNSGTIQLTDDPGPKWLTSTQTEGLRFDDAGVSFTVGGTSVTPLSGLPIGTELSFHKENTGSANTINAPSGETISTLGLSSIDLSDEGESMTIRKVQDTVWSVPYSSEVVKSANIPSGVTVATYLSGKVDVASLALTEGTWLVSATGFLCTAVTRPTTTGSIGESATIEDGTTVFAGSQYGLSAWDAGNANVNTSSERLSNSKALTIPVVVSSPTTVYLRIEALAASGTPTNGQVSIIGYSHAKFTATRQGIT